MDVLATHKSPLRQVDGNLPSSDSDFPSPKKIQKLHLNDARDQRCPVVEPLHRQRLSSSSSTDGVILRFTKSSQNATTPTRGSKLAAGYDLYSAADCVIPSKGKALVPTDIKIELPHGCYGRIAPRSGLAHKHFIDVGAGVIDEDYRGNVGVIMFNFNSEDYKVSKGDRIAQLICEKIFYPELVEVSDLSATDRGVGGYGSTGKN